jgi:hypothetical protein
MLLALMSVASIIITPFELITIHPAFGSLIGDLSGIAHVFVVTGFKPNVAFATSSLT